MKWEWFILGIILGYIPIIINSMKKRSIHKQLSEIGLSQTRSVFIDNIFYIGGHPELIYSSPVKVTIALDDNYFLWINNKGNNYIKLPFEIIENAYMTTEPALRTKNEFLVIKVNHPIGGSFNITFKTKGNKAHLISQHIMQKVFNKRIQKSSHNSTGEP